ncbi:MULTISPECIES: hypothetical protein [Paracoccus]|jgi:hypothetical protein|uniref:Uncharacterized protein n=1 Tax=Paracoccus litorisediminis TaxID=2006130 RepID=A0A844HN49_9RHOB|nr:MULTISPECIES: hypothetical protein [Paracoccus]MBD9526888.1 hypothetical protein [Paracoccus sp. PAR01]MTH59787.1 hypothetical protein [Paracoccus litorisediminis]
MTKGPRPPQAADPREARLKAALRANLARRKAQSRARASHEDLPEDDQRVQDAAPAAKSSENEE